MKVSSRNVVYTAIFGNYDQLLPVNQEWDCDFVCFSDNNELISEGWQIVVQETHEKTPAQANRYYKMLPHKCLSQYEYSLYVDGSIGIVADPSPLFYKYLDQGIIAIPKHQDRDCIYAETSFCLKRASVKKETTEQQMANYAAEGFPEKFGLTENNIIFRKHLDSNIIKLMEAWWEEYCGNSQRDQLSLPYLLWKYNIDFLTVLEGPRVCSDFFQLHLHCNDKESSFFERFAQIVHQRKHLHFYYLAISRTFTFLKAIKESSLFNRQKSGQQITYNHKTFSNIDLSISLACIIVTYHPDMQMLEHQLETLPESAALMLVDNTSDTDTAEALRNLLVRRKRKCLIFNDHNMGLAAAINQGVRQIKIRWPDTHFVLLLDQDSEPLPGSVEILMKKFVSFKDSSPPIGCVGPNLLDPTTGLSHGFHQRTCWRWKRTYPSESDTQPIPCANLNGSGTLVPIDLFLKLGGLDETLFIDHVDTEWSFRVQAAGYALFGIPEAHFIHRMGDNCQRIWLFGWRVWPMRTPQRHYYLFRNAIILMRRDYIPKVWKIWAIIKLMLTATLHGIVDHQRIAQLRNMLKGVRDGMSFRPTLDKGQNLP